jgi:hypothetical protein
MADANTTNFALVKPEVGASLDTWGTKLNTNFDDIDALARGFYTAGGTANAITITTGLSLASIPTGMRIRFNPPGDNTGATTINVDGTGAVACRTIRNAALPAEYILTSLGICQAEYNGTHWVVDRRPDTGTNSDGVWERSPSGTMWVWRDIAISSGGEVNWTFPKAFSSAPLPNATPGGTTDPRNVSVGTATTTAVTIFGRTPAGINWNGNVRVMAVGRWY